MLLVRFLYPQVVLYHWLTTILFVVYTRKSRSIRGARQPCAVVAELLRGSVVEMRGPSARGKFADIWGNNCFIKPSVYRSKWELEIIISVIKMKQFDQDHGLQSDSFGRKDERETVFKKLMVVNLI